MSLYRTSHDPTDRGQAIDERVHVDLTGLGPQPQRVVDHCHVNCVIDDDGLCRPSVTGCDGNQDGEEGGSYSSADIHGSF